MIFRKIFCIRRALSQGTLFLLSAISIIVTALSLSFGISSAHAQGTTHAKYVILMIADGWGQTQIDAANSYTGFTPLYQSDPQWKKHWMSTYPYGCGYNPALAWSNFTYSLNCVTDSAAAATAMYSGLKTQNSRISVSAGGTDRLLTIGEVAKIYGAGVGAISTVPVTDATPGAMMAHNNSRTNYYAIGDEGFFGDPNTTGAPSELYYGGGHGPTFPVADVLIGDGRDSFVSTAAKIKLRQEKGSLGDPNRDVAKHYLVERQDGQNANVLLMQAAGDPYVRKLAGLFDQVYRRSDGSGYTPENPTLSESTKVALTVLEKNPNGFVLMIEGGAVDWAGHANNMDYMVGEMIDFNEAVQEVIRWVEDPSSDSNWNNTLLIVTGDHETGYLTAAPGQFPDQPLGPVNSMTLSKEKIYSGSSGRRASWEDTNNNNSIDSGETVYWAWNTGGHANILVPLFARGQGSSLFDICIEGSDPVRGNYIDNADIARIADSAMSGNTSAGSLSITPGQELRGNPINLTSIVTASNAANVMYTVSEGSGCPAQTNSPVITKGASWKYDIENLGNTWMNTGFNDSFWPSGSGVFGTEASASSYGYSIATPISNSYKSMFFRKQFSVCDPSAVSALKLNALFDDGMVVYINGTQVYRQGVSGNPPQFDGSAEDHEAVVYEAKDLAGVIGLDALRDLLVPGENIIAVGVYNIQNPQGPGTISSDIVWDGELVISSSGSLGILFTGGSIQAQSVSTTGWNNGTKNLTVTGTDATCLAPLPDTNGSFNFVPCIATGSLSIIPGQELAGNPVNLTSIVSASNATNVTYRVTQGPSCPAQANESIIPKRDLWKYTVDNSGTSWMNAGYDDSGWSSGSGVFGTETSAASYGYLIATPISNTYRSMFFRKIFHICDPSEVTSLKLNALFDDGMVVYINGIQVYIQGVTGNPPLFDGGAVEHEAVAYETKDLAGIIGLNALRNVLVPGSNVIAVGVYNIVYPPVPPDPPYISSDIVWDGELILSQNSNVTALFTGDSVSAQSVNTTGWTESIKSLQVTGYDAVCLSPLPDSEGTFAFEYLVNYYCDSDGDSYINANISGTCSGSGCAPSGCQTSSGADCNDGNSAINPAASEACNNVDDNCNGLIDDDLTRQTTCGIGICEGNTGVETCSAGVWGNNTCNPYAGAMPEGPPGHQTCMDDLDNDCDGMTDFADETCHVAFELNCFDGIDEDADSLTDCADPDCDKQVNGVCSTGQPGICSTGILTCQSAAAVCLPDNLPQTEVCDGFDNNCDGAIDENLSRPTTCGMGICSGNTGIETCNAGIWGNNTCDPYAGAMSEGPPGHQTCMDDLDNDCDGITDFADGGCHVDHETDCYNGIDDDADGITDCQDADCAGATNGSCSTGQPGICSTGVLTCQAATALCVPDNLPQTEVCDGVDNNCDGVIDEDLTQPTSCGVGACASAGIEICTAGVWGGDTCTPGTPSAETCNNIDDNCDGSIDEGCDDDGDGYCDNMMTVSGAPVPVCMSSNNGPGDDCNDTDVNIYPGGPAARIIGTAIQYYAGIQPAYDNAANDNIIQIQDRVMNEDLLFDKNKLVTYVAGYNCGFTLIAGQTTVIGNMTISNGTIKIQNGRLVLQ